MDIDYEVQVELLVGNGDYDDVTYKDINVCFHCEVIRAQSDVGISSDYLEIISYELPKEYKGNASVESQVDSCLDWVGDRLNDCNGGR